MGGECLIAVTQRPAVAEPEISDAFCRVYARSTGGDRRRLLQRLLVVTIDEVARTCELPLTRYVTLDGCVRWEHVADTLTLEISAHEGTVTHAVWFSMADGTTFGADHTWFDAATMPCYLTSLVERCFADTFELCHHAAALSPRTSVSRHLLPPGTRGPNGEPADRVSEAYLLTPHPYVLLGHNQVATAECIPWDLGGEGDDE